MQEMRLIRIRFDFGEVSHFGYVLISSFFTRVSHLTRARQSNSSHYRSEHSIVIFSINHGFEQTGIDPKQYSSIESSCKNFQTCLELQNLRTDKINRITGFHLSSDSLVNL